MSMAPKQQMSAVYRSGLPTSGIFEPVKAVLSHDVQRIYCGIYGRDHNKYLQKYQEILACEDPFW